MKRWTLCLILCLMAWSAPAAADVAFGDGCEEGELNEGDDCVDEGGAPGKCVNNNCEPNAADGDDNNDTNDDDTNNDGGDSDDADNDTADTGDDSPAKTDSDDEDSCSSVSGGTALPIGSVLLGLFLMAGVMRRRQ